MHYRYYYYTMNHPAARSWCRGGGIFSFAIKVGITAYAINYLHKRFTDPPIHPQITNAAEDAASFHQRLRESWHHTFKNNNQPPVLNLPNGRFSLEIDLPGIKKENVTLSVNEAEKVVILKGVTPANQEEGRRERTVETRVELPKTVDLSDLKASMVDGVLRVNIGKEEFEGRRVQLE
ncbi:UNVERIFIED_CONTAM: hypothetical protein HDU68_009168 [Siphonaria sp. JEL0065]|nr:hypothetical protein HDU68_009168 [Siphonaria sp. JEL0065]